MLTVANNPSKLLVVLSCCVPVSIAIAPIHVPKESHVSPNPLAGITH